ncbi:MAG TPA: hypothetical protein VGL72_09160 [Bryobacteraceae bacterium]|jgi:hypothetical protein
MGARLGDIIDDYCVKCKRIMNHSVVSCVNDEPAKVRCRTCHGDHDYRHEQAPPSKADLRKAALYKEVLDRMGRGEDGATGEAAVPVDGDAVAAAETVAETATETAMETATKTKRAKAKK